MIRVPTGSASEGTSRQGRLARRFWALAAACAIVLLAASLALTVRLATQPINSTVCPEPTPDIVCRGLPLRLVHDDPECANKLLRAMNITNVRVMPKGSLPPPLDNDTIAHLSHLCVTLERQGEPLPSFCRYARHESDWIVDIDDDGGHATGRAPS